MGWFIPLLCIILGNGCAKKGSYAGTATIIGIDARMSVCAGGYFIKIDGHPNPLSEKGYYDIGDIPSSFGLDKIKVFPVHVLLDWQVGPNCSGNYVNISRIERIE